MSIKYYQDRELVFSAHICWIHPQYAATILHAFRYHVHQSPLHSPTPHSIIIKKQQQQHTHIPTAHIFTLPNRLFPLLETCWIENLWFFKTVQSTPSSKPRANNIHSNPTSLNQDIWRLLFLSALKLPTSARVILLHWQNTQPFYFLVDLTTNGIYSTNIREWCFDLKCFVHTAPNLLHSFHTLILQTEANCVVKIQYIYLG